MGSALQETRSVAFGESPLASHQGRRGRPYGRDQAPARAFPAEPRRGNRRSPGPFSILTRFRARGNGRREKGGINFAGAIAYNHPA